MKKRIESQLKLCYILIWHLSSVPFCCRTRRSVIKGQILTGVRAEARQEYNDEKIAENIGCSDSALWPNPIDRGRGLEHDGIFRLPAYRRRLAPP